MLKVTLYIDVDQGLRHMSYVLTGLFLLARQGRISLRAVTPEPGTWQKLELGNMCVPIEVSHSGSAKPVPVCFDQHDKSNVFYPGPLEGCAVYFKRSYFQPDIAQLPAPLGAKVLPFGFSFPCRTRRSYPAVLRSAGRTVLRATRGSRPSPGYLRYLTRNLSHYARLPRPADIERGAAVAKQEAIVFQPRLWEEHEVAGERAETINEERVTIVRLLRREFPRRFHGGLVPTPLAQRRYPDLLAPTHPRAYIPMMRDSLIGIYTRGLHHSTASKLGEYLAASLCVVAEPIRNESFSPLEPGRHLLSFSSPEECVEACAAILRDPELQREMRLAVQRYYAEHVEPAAHLLRCLERVRQVEA